jgi:hypothetical protein
MEFSLVLIFTFVFTCVNTHVTVAKYSKKIKIEDKHEKISLLIGFLNMLEKKSGSISKVDEMILGILLSKIVDSNTSGQKSLNIIKHLLRIRQKQSAKNNLKIKPKTNYMHWRQGRSI